MKYLFSIVLVCVLGVGAFGQGTFQFNRVVTWQGTVTSTGNGNYAIAGPTIPVGKIWKVEHASLTLAQAQTQPSLTPYLNNTANTAYSIIVNGLVLNEFAQNSTGPIYRESSPVWLESGTFPVYVYIYFNLGPYAYTVAFNVIEYNIIP